ncbi:MAG TPA: hypothetical protein VET48_05175, partial [Steroidobacteraceae bacterium]|nr:hypothetical protein [Steroidobacteraceae bacterium]
MSDIVIVPAYFRPEFLALCLGHLERAAGSSDKEIWICQDWHVGDHEKFEIEWKETQSVISEAKKVFGEKLRTIVRPENSYYGNSCNVLSAYKRAFITNAELVYLVEEDVLVTPDFFQWHEQTQQETKPFCSVAGYSHEPGAEAFASLGVCWRRENLAPILEHAKPDYYEWLANYLKVIFPDSRYGVTF